MKFFALRLLLFVILTLSASGATFASTTAGEVVAVADGDTITVSFRRAGVMPEEIRWIAWLK